MNILIKNESHVYAYRRHVSPNKFDKAGTNILYTVRIRETLQSKNCTPKSYDYLTQKGQQIDHM
jgi:hypothetical protein